MPETDARPFDPATARAQEAEFFGVATGFDYDLGGGESWTLPLARYMPPDMRMRYLEHMAFLQEGLDKEDQVHPITGKIQKRDKFPARVNGKLVDEDELLCRALMTDEVYDKFVAAGGVPGQVQARWQMMNRQMEERLKRDPQFPAGA